MWFTIIFPNNILFIHLWKYIVEKSSTLNIVFVSYKYSCKRAGVFCIAIIVLAHTAFLNKKILSRSIMLTPFFTSSLQFIPNVQIDGLRPSLESRDRIATSAPRPRRRLDEYLAKWRQSYYYPPYPRHEWIYRRCLSSRATATQFVSRNCAT